MNLIKVKVIGAPFALATGTLAGLDTRWANRLEGFIQKIGPHLYKVTKDVKLPKDAIFWIDVKKPDGKAPEGTEQIDMPRGYLETHPREAEKTAAVIKELKKPKKGKRWKNPSDSRDSDKDAA